MKAKYLVGTSLLLGFVLYLIVAPALSSSAEQKEKGKKEAQAEEKIFIPKGIKLVLQQGLASRQGPQAILFSIIKHLYLPTRDGFHNIFLLKIKNSDLGYAPPVVAPQKAEKAKKEKEEVPPPAEAVPPSRLQARFNVFLQFNLIRENAPPQVVREVYVPGFMEAESSTYDPAKEEIYSIGYPTYSGKYLLAMAITSLDLKKIGTFFYEFFLPDLTSFSKELDTTPVFFVKEMKQMSLAETRAEIHKGFFTYSILQVVPNIDSTFSVGESLDILYYIFGTQPNAEQQYQIETNYEVKKGEETVIRYEPTTYTSPLVSQPLPMKQTVIIKSEKEGERNESRDLAAGNYTLHIKILDKVTGNSVTKNVDFEVK